jgi:glycosyltransferase EpsF
MKRVLHIIGKMDRAGAGNMLMNLYRSIDRSKIQFDFIALLMIKVIMMMRF